MRITYVAMGSQRNAVSLITCPVHYPNLLAHESFSDCLYLSHLQMMSCYPHSFTPPGATAPSPDPSCHLCCIKRSKPRPWQGADRRRSARTASGGCQNQRPPDRGPSERARPTPGSSSWSTEILLNVTCDVVTEIRVARRRHQRTGPQHLHQLDQTRTPLGKQIA